MFSVSITHHLKIRELSDGNKNWKQSYEKPNKLLSYGSHHFWVMSDGNRVMSYGNTKSKHPLICAKVLNGLIDHWLPNNAFDISEEVWEITHGRTIQQP